MGIEQNGPKMYFAICTFFLSFFIAFSLVSFLFVFSLLCCYLGMIVVCSPIYMVSTTVSDFYNSILKLSVNHKIYICLVCRLDIKVLAMPIRHFFV
jgi:asparagine N-glycosylation enzyme membrane subunit Stt3